MTNEVTTAAHIRALFVAMRARTNVVILYPTGKKTKPLIIERMNLDGVVDLYNKETGEIEYYDVNPDNVKILQDEKETNDRNP